MTYSRTHYIIKMATLTTEYIDINDNHLNVEIVHISVFVQPEIHIEIDPDTDIDIETKKKEVTTEEKRRLFYKQRLEIITKCLQW